MSRCIHASRAAQWLAAPTLALNPWGQAEAHGLGARYDLPVPLWLYLLGAAAAVTASFGFLVLFRRNRRIAQPRRLVIAAGTLPAWLVAGLRALALALFVLIVTAGLFGNQSPFKNIAPVFVWVIWWVGMTFLAAFFVDAWKLVSPPAITWPWLAAFLRPRTGDGPVCSYPRWLGAWPACSLFLFMAWLELVAPARDVPRNLALGALAYLGLMWAGCFLFGPHTWIRNADPYAMVFSILGRFAPLQIIGTGRSWSWRLQPHAVGLLPLRPLSIATTAFTLLMLATVSVDGILETPPWAALVQWADGTDAPSQWSGGTLATGLLCVTPLVFGAAYLIIVSLMRTASGEEGHCLASLSGQFVLPLVPIAIAYSVAHNLSFLLLAGQFAIPLASDPFGFGWDLFGTALYRIDIGIVSARVMWFVAIGAIVAGHILATWLSHETALVIFRTPRAARRSQAPMLALMIGYTVLSLWILAQPIVQA